MAFAAVGGAAAIACVAFGRLDVALLAVAVAFIPFIAVLGMRRPDVLAGLFVFAQPLEAFEVPTPVTTVSVGNILLVILVLTNASSILSILRSSRVAQIAAALLLGWLVMYPLRSLHDPAGQVLRATVTMASFVLVAAAGLAVAPHPRTLRAIAYGSLGALMILAVAGILVNFDLAPMTERVNGPRNLLGFTSPFLRTYGLNVPFDAATLLVPLSVPFFGVRALERSSSRAGRAGAVLAVCLIGFACLLIFQSRGMLLEIAASLALAGVLAVPRRYRIGAMVGLGAVLVVIAVRLISADQISSGLRGGIGIYAIQSVLADPARFILGVQERAFYSEAAAAIGLQDWAPTGTALHNFFLSTVIGGGIIAFALIAGFHAIAVWAPLQRWRNAPSLNSRAMLVAVTVVLIGLSIEPASASIVGSWLLLGLAIGRGTDRAEHRPKRPVSGGIAPEGATGRTALIPSGPTRDAYAPDAGSSGDTP